MERQNKTLIVIVAILAVTVLCMSIGFANYGQDLVIQGTTTVEAAKWDVHFKEGTYSLTAGSKEATSYSLNTTTMTYEVTLEKPGDFYEFTVTVENGGTFDASLKALTMTSLTAEQSKYLTYTITYDGTTYNATTENLSIALASGATKDVKIRVSYIQPDDATDLPSTEQTISLTATLSYIQA